MLCVCVGGGGGGGGGGWGAEFAAVDRVSTIALSCKQYLVNLIVITGGKAHDPPLIVKLIYSIKLTQGTNIFYAVTRDLSLLVINSISVLNLFFLAMSRAFCAECIALFGSPLFLCKSDSV